jgi:hypothetical protein
MLSGVLDKELDSVLAALAFELVNKVVAVGALALMIMFGSVVCHVHLLRIYFFCSITLLVLTPLLILYRYDLF